MKQINKIYAGIILLMLIGTSLSIAGTELFPKTDKQIDITRSCKTILDTKGYNQIKVGITECFPSGMCTAKIYNNEYDLGILAFPEGTNTQIERDKVLEKYLNDICLSEQNPLPEKTTKLGEGIITTSEIKK
jgi:hypothetical protein